MTNQLKVSMYKWKRFWVLYVAYVILGAVGITYGYLKLSPAEGAYEGFLATISDTSFVFIITMVTAGFVGSDFSNRTIQHEITTGHNRLSVILVRALPVFFSAISMHVLYIVSTMIGIWIKSGTMGQHFTGQDILWLVTVLMQVAAVQSIIQWIAFLCRNAAVGIAASILFTFMTCNVLRNFLESRIFTISVFCFVRESSYETLIPALMIAIVVIFGMLFLTYQTFRKAELR